MTQRGRPRDAAVDRAVLSVAIDLLAERGRHGATIEAIAERSGVAKSSIYRRWSGRDDLMLDALGTLFVRPFDEIPAGDPRDQLRFLLRQLREQWADHRFRRVMRRLAADGSEAPDDYRRFREMLISQRRTRLRATVERCQDEGYVRSGVDLGWVVDLLIAPVIVAAMTHRNDVTEEQLEFSIDTVLRGLATN